MKTRKKKHHGRRDTSMPKKTKQNPILTCFKNANKIKGLQYLDALPI